MLYLNGGSNHVSFRVSSARINVLVMDISIIVVYNRNKDGLSLICHFASIYEKMIAQVKYRNVSSQL